ncbi:MAG: elongation factor G [Cyanophyceae cyanobacterium]
MTLSSNSSIRNIALVGPYSSGKTTLLESLLAVTGAITRKGSIKEGNTLGDHAPEARDRTMGVELNVASLDYRGVFFNWIDCPGSVELGSETYNALIGVDAAVVVCEPMLDRVLTMAPLFQFLDDWEIPHLVFINKMDRTQTPIAELLDALRTVSSRPLVPHQYPIRENQDLVGFIDLVTEQAYSYHQNAAPDPIPLPQSLQSLEAAARQEMLETLADYDDNLLEELLDEIRPSESEIVDDLKMELGADLIVPVFMGIAEQDFGTRPLLDALLREAPEPELTAQRRSVERIKFREAGAPVAQVLKTFQSQQGGKMSLVRVWQGVLEEGMIVNGVRLGGVYHLMGHEHTSVARAAAGEIVGLARLDGVHTGDTIAPTDQVPSGAEPSALLPRAESLDPVFAWAIAPVKRQDDVKLTGALTKLAEEDPAIAWEQHGDTHEIILWGQGEIHLQIALDRLKRKYNLPIDSHQPQIAYRETVRRSANHVHGRYKHQTGGHGQYGDVYLDVAPLPRGEGFNFNQRVVGGVVPKQYIPGVEHGVREALVEGPLGFPVVDVAVTLTDGSYHSVDSSEQAFKQAARIAMQTAMANAEPQLLEPIALVEVSTPNSFTSGVLQLISGRRGQILGYETKPNWEGWDLVQAYLPQAEMRDLIVSLRSLTLGVGTFSWRYDHLQPVPEKLTQQVLSMAPGRS